jgi:hypothetical protein
MIQVRVLRDGQEIVKDVPVPDLYFKRKGWL